MQKAFQGVSLLVAEGMAILVAGAVQTQAHRHEERSDGEEVQAILPKSYIETLEHINITYQKIYYIKNHNFINVFHQDTKTKNERNTPSSCWA